MEEKSRMGVSSCYVFKSRLQEYAQKVGLPTPVYETVKEGPSHEPSFHSTVIVNDVRYDSFPGFFNRKAAEQSAAEVALMELAKSSDISQCISQPVHETGLCKNLLQEYAQKMNYAIPLYQCQKEEIPGRVPHFSCTVEIGGIRYIGAAARTKREAEIKAARTALLAIRSSTTELSEKPVGHYQLTVIPCKKRGAEPTVDLRETEGIPKVKKSRFKKKLRRKLSGNNIGFPKRAEDATNLMMGREDDAGSGLEAFRYGLQVMGSAPFNLENIKNPQKGTPLGSFSERDVVSTQETVLSSLVQHEGIKNGQSGVLFSKQGNEYNPAIAFTDKSSGADERSSMINTTATEQFEASRVRDCTTHSEERIQGELHQ